MSLANLTPSDYRELLNGSDITKLRLQALLEQIVSLTNVLEGTIAPTFAAPKHQWYLDTATQKYYRNVDGGTTWVALN